MAYNEGKGIEKDPRKAFYWFKLAAEQGDEQSQYEIARKYRFGDGVEKDYEEAIKWYKECGRENELKNFLDELNAPKPRREEHAAAKDEVFSTDDGDMESSYDDFEEKRREEERDRLIQESFLVGLEADEYDSTHDDYGNPDYDY